MLKMSVEFFHHKMLYQRGYAYYGEIQVFSFSCGRTVVKGL